MIRTEGYFYAGATRVFPSLHPSGRNINCPLCGKSLFAKGIGAKVHLSKHQKQGDITLEEKIKILAEWGNRA